MKHFSLAALCAAAIPPLAHGSCLPSLIKSVKLQQTTDDFLNIFELQILDPTGANVALGKAATQSSVFYNYGPCENGCFGSNAIDGNMGTWSHSVWEANAWLNVDLGASHEVEKIVIQNRWCGDPSDSYQCLCRLSQANLLIYDDSGAVLSSFSVGDTCGIATLEYNLCLTGNPTKVRSHYLLCVYKVDYFCTHSKL
jgi:hypothetical protein